jgi:hypothetical protein
VSRSSLSTASGRSSGAWPSSYARSIIFPLTVLHLPWLSLHSPLQNRLRLVLTVPSMVPNLLRRARSSRYAAGRWLTRVRGKLGRHVRLSLSFRSFRHFWIRRMRRCRYGQHAFFFFSFSGHLSRSLVSHFFQCHACWVLSHICDGAPADISSVIAGLQLNLLLPPRHFQTLLTTDISRGAPAVAQLLIGGWTRSPFSLALDPPVAQRPGPPALPHVTMWPTESAASSGTIRLVSTAAKLVRFLRHESLRVCKPALRAVGNIVCAEDDCDLTQNMVDLGVVPLLASLVRSPARDIQKEVCWTLR